MDSLAYSTALPCLATPFAQSVHRRIVTYICNPSVLHRLSSKEPAPGIISLLGWYGQYEVSGVMAFIFGALIPDAEGAVLLIYRVRNNQNIQDRNSPFSTLTLPALHDLINTFRTRENQYLRLSCTERVGYASHYFARQKRWDRLRGKPVAAILEVKTKPSIDNEAQ